MLNLNIDNPKIVSAIIGFLNSSGHNLQTMFFFGEFASSLNYINDKTGTIPTCGVNATREGLNFYYNDEFVNKLTTGSLNFVMLHEIYHLLFSHTDPRRVAYRDKLLSNVAQDMLINYLIYEEYIKIPMRSKFEFPLDDKGKNTCCFIPKTYTGELIYEDIYDWLLKEKERINNEMIENGTKMEYEIVENESGDGGLSIKPKNKGNSGGGNGNGNEEEGGNGDKKDGNSKNNKKCNSKSKEKPQSEPLKYGKYGRDDVECYSHEERLKSIINEDELMHTLDVHLNDTVSEEHKQNMVDRIKNSFKNRGILSNDLEMLLEKLHTKRKDYLREIKKAMSDVTQGFTKHKTYTRLNRKGFEGFKGNVKYKNVVNCILDVSGSMCGEFEFVLSYVFQNNIHINLIQVDSGVKSVKEIKTKQELQKVKILGLGGTTLTPGFEYIAKDKKLRKINTVVLTDGYTDCLDLSGVMGKTLILSTDRESDYKNNKFSVKQIILKK